RIASMAAKQGVLPYERKATTRLLCVSSLRPKGVGRTLGLGRKGCMSGHRTPGAAYGTLTGQSEQAVDEREEPCGQAGGQQPGGKASGPGGESESALARRLRARGLV